MKPELTYDHLIHLTSPSGLYEHALGSEPRIEHGHCVDDVARALVVTSREPRPSRVVTELANGYLDFVLAAQCENGLMHNRRLVDGTWADTESAHDHWGRAIWALGIAATSGRDARFVSRARDGARLAMRARSFWPRAMAYATLGAGALLSGAARHLNGDSDPEARALIRDARAVLDRPRSSVAWPWPEARLTYANAVLPEAMLVIGEALPDERAFREGLALLTWLVRQQERDGRLSVVPSGGRSDGDPTPGFAQQPIEVACLAEAAHRAFLLTRDPRWADVVRASHAWFEGANDLGLPMRDAATGAGFDGLERGGVNLNQGAESTLAWLSTDQLSHHVLEPVFR